VAGARPYERETDDGESPVRARGRRRGVPGTTARRSVAGSQTLSVSEG